jgi:hypothetical protein
MSIVARQEAHWFEGLGAMIELQVQHGIREVASPPIPDILELVMVDILRQILAFG